MKKKKLLKILLLMIVISISIIIICIFSKSKKEKINITTELLRTQSYKDVMPGDETVYDENGEKITAIQFDAFFLKDKDGDGEAESIRGTCNEIGSEANLYMELNVIEEGQLKNATITINANNFYFNTAIVKDNIVAENYISSNTKSIKFNNMENGSQTLLIGAVRSGDYSSELSKTDAIGNNTTNYSKENTVTLTGTYVDNVNGEEKVFTKTVAFTVDWYGKVNAEIYPQAKTITTSDFNELVSSEGLTLDFNVSVSEEENQLILSGSYITGTIPEINGYKPISVTIYGTDVTYEYNQETGEFKAQREAKIDENGIITTNAFTSEGKTKKNKFDFLIIYPIEAYEEMGEEISSIELAIPIQAVNKGFNNSNTEDGFQNPYTSNTATAIVVTTWKKSLDEINSPFFRIEIGSRIEKPYNTYNGISKAKPLNIYNGISLEETNDTYMVEWRAFTGTYGKTNGIIMNETTGKTDTILNTLSEYISMDEFTANKGIYFEGATDTLGLNGWIKIYNAETDTLIKTFTSNNWNSYTKSNPYLYENKVKHIRIETSATNELSYLHVYNIKELDDEYITENFIREEFDQFAYIESYLDGYMIEQTDNSNEDGTEQVTYWYNSSDKDRAIYASLTSVANISIKEDTISTKSTAENQRITIETECYGDIEQKWKNGMFLVKLPRDIIFTEINSIITSNKNLKISAYDLYQENGNYFIKILTENEKDESYRIVIDCDLTPDPRIPKKTDTIELYAINEIACDYYYSQGDIYDIDGDLNKVEKVNYKTTTLTMDPGTSLNTTQIGSNYGVEDEIIIAPQVAKTDKEQRKATINISATNNYDFDIQDIKIQGVVPFEGNDYILTGRDLGSTFTTYMTEAGIVTVTGGLQNFVTVYYSATENPTNDINDKANSWTLAENVEDWSIIKTYLIVIDNAYKLKTGDKIEFEYEISIPEGVDYNDVTYSAHAIYYSLMTNEGLYYTSTASEKLGFMIAKQFDLEIIKYQEDTDKTLQGITFSLKEEGQENSTIKVTDANGIMNFTGLYVERYYVLKEEKTTEDYVLNGEEIKFYTKSQINEDGTESLYLEYINEDGTHSTSSEIYSSIIEDSVIEPNQDSEEDYKIQLKIGNEVKVRLTINKTDKTTGQALKNIKFTLTGDGKNEEILITDTNGNINVYGLYLDKEYILTEIKATSYYIPQEPIKFIITNDNGEFKFVNYTDNGTTASNIITINEEIPTIKLNLQNERIPTYRLQLTKYAKGEKEINETGEEVDKVLNNAQYKITGEGINGEGKIYATDNDGIITIDGLYEYVEGKYITGEYTLTEIYAPEGYSLNSTSLKFKAYRENGTLKLEILEGEDFIRTINVTESKKDLNIVDANETYPIIQIGAEDSQIFTLFKYSIDGTTNEKIPIPGTKFVITDLEGNYVTGSDGNTIGEWDETLQKYVVTTDANGQLVANVKEGLYKAVEVYVDDKYILSENEEDRTYYFGIGTSQAMPIDWANSISGKGWDYINSIVATSDGGTIGVGEFSEYLINTTSETQNGIDLNKDGIIENVSQGDSDGIIVYYDVSGNYIWSKSFGGTDDDALNKVIQTSDGGYAAVGYVTSNIVKYDGKEIVELSRTEDNTNLGNKDAILLKIDKKGNYEWGIRFGGTLDDEIKSIIETRERNLVVVGNFYSSTFNIYEYNAGTISDVKESFSNLGTNTNVKNGFLISYSETGKYEWSQRVSGTSYTEMVDITETTKGIVIALYNKETIYFDTDQTQSQMGAWSYAIIAGYTLDGTYSWNYRYASNYSRPVNISSITTDYNDNIIGALQSSGENKMFNATLIQLSNEGTYIKNIYTLKGSPKDDLFNVEDGNYDEYISDVVPTSDGGYLFGGWYYSTGGIDVDGDGLTTGENDFPEVSGKDTSDGFVIKIDAEGQVQYSSRLYGEGYEGVTSVAEMKNGSIASGGYFNSTSLSATNFEKQNSEEDEETPTDIILNSNGNSEGFIISKATVEGGAVVPEAQNLQIENKIKQLKITTQVIKHDENGTQVAGGDIDGEEGTFGEIEYSKDGIRYVETVNYGENSTKEITITPESGYTISYVKINDVEYTNFTTNQDGTVTLPIFENVTENKHIIVEFSNTISSLEVNYYLWTAEGGITTQKVSNSEYSTGNVGDKYTTIPVTDIDYEIITNADYYGENLPSNLIGTDYYIPENYTGNYMAGQKQVVNYYYKEKTYTLTVHHYIAGTNEQVPLKGSVTGETVEDEFTEGLKKGEEYITTQAAEDLIDYSIYELLEIPENAEGTIEENTEVTYYYQIKTAGLSFTKVAEEDHNMVLAGTEFALYKLNDENAVEKDELIDVEDIASCWTLVNTYTTNETGKVNLINLPITSEYRLVETKSAEDRLIPEGQWKIEFIYGEYDENDTSIITVAGTKLKITAIGNPPALAITEEGNLELPNKEYFNFPTSGDIGSITFYQIGIITIVIGITLLISRKYLLIKMKSKNDKKGK